MRLAARGRPGIAGVVPGSVTGLCPQSRGGDAQQPGGGEGHVRAARTFCGKSGAMHVDRVCIAPKTGENVRERQTRDKQKRATALFLRDRPQAFPFGSSFTFPFPLAPLDGHKPAQAR